MRVHFVGIGGIGMSSLARILLQKGQSVSGSDRKKGPHLDELVAMGARVFYEHKSENVDGADLMVVSTAIANDHPEILEGKKRNIPILHRSEMLHQLMRGKKTLLVTGCHGKTGTSALLYWVLRNLSPSYSIGGIVLDVGNNGGWGMGEYFIAEADESDGSFLVYDPYAAIVTNIDVDHLDHWKDADALYQAYEEFMAKPEVLIHGCQAENIKQRECFVDFEYKGSAYSLKGVGKHLAHNAACVIELALKLGLSPDEINARFNTFPGVKRRGEFVGCRDDVLVFDDYAHHPVECAALFTSFRKAHPDRRIVALFQPHRYSRLEAFFKPFSEALSMVDLPLITDVFSAGEKARNIDGKNLAEAVERAIYIPYDNIPSELENHLQKGDLFLTVGAGNVTEVGAKWIGESCESR